MPLEILHRAARRRNVPVTFTLYRHRVPRLRNPCRDLRRRVPLEQGQPLRRAHRVLLEQAEPPLVCLHVGVRGPSPASCPRRAALSIGALANAVGLRSSQAPAAAQRVSGEAVAGIAGFRSQWARSVSTIVRIGLPGEARYNRSVDSDALRQGAARRCGTSCTARPLAATRRSPSRYMA